MAGGVFGVFTPAPNNLAATRELDIEPDALDELSMRLALRRARMLLADDKAARMRLDAADEPFWVAVRETLA